MSDVGDGPVLVVLAAGRATRYGGVKPLAPVGPAGEPVLDLLCSDALAAGFSTIVIVVGPTSGPAIRYHVERTWPATVDVRFALQEVPLGTVHAVLASSDQLAAGAPFGVANADDVYGESALTLLADHLRKEGSMNALVGYQLQNAVIGHGPVTRGVCETDGDGALVSVIERRKIVPTTGGRFEVGDGLQPALLDGDVLVSTNLWGFGPEMRDLLEAAMDGDPHASEDAEVLLPEVVGSALDGHRPGGIAPSPFRVLETASRCVGVTHNNDVALVQKEIAAQVGEGERPAALWYSIG
jgi:hypothetical protein